LVVLAACFVTAPAWADTKIGVVNVATVSEKYLKTKDLESQFDALRKSLGQQRDAMKEKIERAKAALQEELKPGTAEFHQRRKEIAMMEAELQWFVESEGQKVEKGLAEALRSIFDDIHACVKEVAEEQGVQIVLAADNVPAESPDTPNQARQTILLQKVLFWKPEVDMTETVLTKLNQRFRTITGSGTGAAPAAGVDKPKTPAKPADSKKP
jgi:Skp family chaperone for outer membrane proteins